jgi:hypothetical protein
VIEVLSVSKLATIYRRKGALFVAASHKTEAGFWIADKEISVVESSDEGGIQKAVVEALETKLHTLMERCHGNEPK